MNAAAITAFSTRAAATGAALWPATVLLGGVEYAAQVPEPKVMGNIISGGEESAGELVVRILVADLATRPSAQQELRWKRAGEAGYRAPRWWVDSVRKSPLDVEWVLVCTPKN